MGLTDAEAAARRPNVDFAAITEAEQRAFLSHAIRANLFTLFNLDLFVIAILMLLLGSPWSTFLTLLVLTINTCLNVLQEVVTKRRLDALLHTLRPQATVIRGGMLASVDGAEIVPGDMVVIGRGDEIFVDGIVVGDGELTFDLSTTRDSDQQIVKRAGDRVYAQTFCADGRAIYTATEAGAFRVAERRSGVQLLTEERTPLRSLLRAVLISLFAIVVLFSILVLRDSIIGGKPLVSDRYREAFSLIFRVAPTSLFFILIVDYAVGLLRIANVGGLAYRSTAVESLANVSILCLSLRSILQGTQVSLEEMPEYAGRTHVSMRLIRRMLGDLASNAPYRMPTIEALADALPGRRRAPVEAAGHFAALGWYGISFRDSDMSGTFVLGEAAVLSPHFVRKGPAPAPPAKEVQAQRQRRGVLGFLRLGWRTKKEAPHESTEPETNATTSRERSDDDAPKETADGGARFQMLRQHVRGFVQFVRRKESRATDSDEPLRKTLEPGHAIARESGQVALASAPATGQADAGSGAPHRMPRWRRFANQLTRLRRPHDQPEPAQQMEQTPAEVEQPRSLLFAYRPEIVPLADAQQRPHLPDGLIPLARITLTETVRPEMVATMRDLRRAGIAITLLSHEDSARVRQLVQALSMRVCATSTDNDDIVNDIAGDSSRPPAATAGTALIGLAAEKQVQILRRMHERGAYVAMVGDSVGDLPAMREAQLRIVLRSSSQIAFKIADIVLLADSLAALPEILRAGQRIINAVLNTLKLNLSQIAAQLLLLGAFVMLPLPHFFYGATQAAVISAYTLTIPNIFMRFWAPTGGITAAAMRRTLARLVVPAMIANGLLALAIHLIFWRPTSDAAYAQLATTYGLLGAGWLLILFVLPPTRFWAVATRQVGDRRVVRLVAALICLFFATVTIPLFRQWLHIDWLPSVTDYFVVAVALGLWMLGLQAIWRTLARVTDDASRM